MCFPVLAVATQTSVIPKKAFIIKSGPPPGFVQLAKNPHQNTFVSIFYAGNFLTNVRASFTNDHIKFQDPAKLVEKLGKLEPADRKVLIKALSGTLGAHENKICPYGNTNAYCAVLHPKIAGVIFNAQTYRVDLFLNPKFIKLQQSANKKLPNSSASLSFLTQNNVQATKVQSYKGYSVADTSIIADGNDKLTANVGYTQSELDGVSSHNLNLSELSGSRLSNGVLYQGGLVSEATGSFFNTPGIGGVDVKNYGVFTDTASEIKGSPLIVYLALPSTVVVKRKGQILTAQSLSAGKQALNTKNFPIGSYDVTVQITNQLGQVTTETRFYVKQDSLPQYGKHNYDISFGFLQKETYQTSEDQFVTHPSLENVPVFSYHEMRTMAPSIGLGTTFISSGSRSYLSEVLNFYRNELQVSPGVMLSSKFDKGVMLNAQYTGLHESVSLDGTRVWRSQKFNEGLLDINQSSDTFYPLLTNRTQIQSNISVFHGDNQINLGGSWFDDFSGQKSETTSASYTRSFNMSEIGYAQLTASLTHEDHDDVGLVSLNYSFNVASINGNAILKYSNQNATTAGKHKYEPSGDLSLNHSFMIDTNKTISVSAGVSASKNTQTDSLAASLNMPLIGGNFSVSHNSFSNGYGTDNTQYTAQLESSLTYAAGHWSMGYGHGLTSGVVVKVSSPKPGRFALYDNGLYLGAYSNNESYPVFVPPYEVHRFTIQPMGASIYTYDKNPKESVLYLGNVQYLHWSLEREYLLFGKVVDSRGKALPNLLFNNRGEFDVTGDYGYVQANITRHTRKLRFTNIKGGICIVTLPSNIKITHGVAVMKQNLVCKET